MNTDHAAHATDQAKTPYQELNEIVRQHGWLEKASGRILAELGLHVMLHAGGMALFIATDNLWIKAAAILVSTYGGLGIATNTHTSSHYATSRNLWLNRALTYFGYTFLFGTAATYWWNKHCVVHHPAPNVIDVDDDADVMPFFAINERDYAASRGLRRFYYDHVQWILIPFALALNTFFTQYQGWRYLLPFLFDPKRRKRAHWIDLAVLLAHIAVFIVVPMFYFAPLSVLGFYFLRNALMGYAMFIAFAPAHFPDEALFIDKNQMKEDYILRQCATTINFRTGFLGRLVCSGVDYQIEHHLFPGVPHVYYPEMSKVLKKFCEERGYPYRTLGWWEATWKSLLVFYRPKKIFDRTDALRHPPVGAQR